MKSAVGVDCLHLTTYHTLSRAQPLSPETRPCRNAQSSNARFIRNNNSALSISVVLSECAACALVLCDGSSLSVYYAYDQIVSCVVTLPVSGASGDIFPESPPSFPSSSSSFNALAS